MKLSKTSILKLFLAMALVGSVLAARADYRTTILGDTPAAFWRLDDPVTTTVCSNYGSAGTALNAYYNLGKFVSKPGAIVGDSDPGTGFDGVMNRVEVPYTPALNTTNAFSVEFWALRTINSSAASTYYSPVWSRGNASTCNGYLFYVDPNNKWMFWMGATNATGNYWMHADGKTAITANTWYHVVGTYGPVLTNGVVNWYASLYVNGVLQNMVAVSTNNGSLSHQPNSPSTTATPYISPFRIGCGNYAMTASVPWPGSVDEVAFYTNALTDSQVLNHYSNATNALRSVSYFSAITNDSPLAYWRLNETNTAIAYNQVGTSAGTTANGIYAGSPVIPASVDPATGILINPSNYPGTLKPLVTGALTGDSNPGLGLMPWAAGNATGAKVEIPYTPALNTKTFSIECWANVEALGTWNSLVSSRTVVTGANGGYDILVNNTGQLQFWVGGGGSASVKLIAGTPFQTGVWNHVVAVYDGSYIYLYMNGELVGTMPMAAPFLPNLSNPMRIGAGATETVQGNFCVTGRVDEVAFYPYPLSGNQVVNHYSVGLGTSPVAVTAPVFTVQPDPTTTLETGGTLKLTGIATGSLPMRYQWYKDGNPLLQQTNTTLVVSNLTAAGSGTYELWVTNAVSAVNAAAFVTVNGLAAPTLSRDLPPTTTYYPGADLQLSVSAEGSLPFTYYWSSNNTTVAITNVPVLLLTNVQAAASGASYSVIVSNAAGKQSSTTTVLQALTPVASDYVSRALQLKPISYWRLGDAAPSTFALDSWGANQGQYVSVNQHYTPGALTINDDGCAKFPGGATVQMPSIAPFGSFSTTNRFTIMAWINPDIVTGIQRVFSTRQATPYAGGFGFGLNAKNLVFSGFGVADIAFTANLNAGTWYHVAAVYSNKTVTCYVNGSVVGTANAVLNSLLPSSAPLYLGGNPTASEYFNGLIDEAAVYGTALSPAQILEIFGTKPSITTQPASVNVVAGAGARFSITGSGQTPLRYQWRTNGVAMVNQTNTTLVLPRVPLEWNNLEVVCVLTNSLGAITSAPVTLTVTTSSGYLAGVLADAPVAYWRLNESGGPTIRDFVDSHDGTAMGSSITYRSQTMTTPLELGGDSDPCVGFSGSGLFAIPFYPELNQRTFSVECWAAPSGLATTFAAPVASRYGTTSSGFNLYAGMEGNMLGYTWQMWTATGISTYPWDYAVGPAVYNYLWTHLVATYNGSNVVFYVNGEPAATNALTFVTNSISPFSIGAIASGTQPSISAYFNGNVDEVAYYGYALSPYQAKGHYLLAGFGNNKAPQITEDLVPQTAYANLPWSLSAAAVGSIPLTYQWYKNGVPVPGQGGTSDCATNLFSLDFASVKPADQGSYQLWVTNSLGTANTISASLTVVQPPQLGRATYSPATGCQLTFSGPAGQTYRLWTSTNVALTPIETTWDLLSSGVFSGAQESFTDADARQAPERFYILTLP